jgi:hypothetical protein
MNSRNCNKLLQPREELWLMKSHDNFIQYSFASEWKNYCSMNSAYIYFNFYIL